MRRRSTLIFYDQRLTIGVRQSETPRPDDAPSPTADFTLHIDLHPVEVLPPFFDLPICGGYFG